MSDSRVGRDFMSPFALTLANGSSEDRPCSPARLLGATKTAHGARPAIATHAAAAPSYCIGQAQQPNGILNRHLLNSSPYMMTALSMDGTMVAQTPLSMRYFGVVSAQPSNTLDTALPMALLQRLFQLEGQETLEDMLATVLSNRSAAADGNGEEQGWRRVIRVPVTCVPTAQEASTLPPLPQTLRSAFAAVSQPLMSEARSGLSDTLNQTYMNLSSPQSPAATPRARSNMLSMLSSRGASGLVELPLGNYASGSYAPASCNSINEHSSMRSASSIGTPRRSQSLLNTDTASAVSVAVRNAPPRMKSLLDYTMASRTASASGPLLTLQGPSSSSTCTEPPAPCRPLSSGSLGAPRPSSYSATLPPVGSASCRSSSLPQMHALEQRLSNCMECEDEGPSDAMRAPQPRGARPHFAQFLIGDLGDHGLGAYGAWHAGDSRTTDCAPQPSASAEGTRVPLTQAVQAQAGAKPAVRLEGELQEHAATRAASQDGDVDLFDPEDCQWHEVFVTMVVDEEDGSVVLKQMDACLYCLMVRRELLLIYQTDVTMRTQLETTMAALTDAQLNTLCQLFPRHVIEFLSTGGDLSQPANLGTLARSHADVAILFTDICGFTSMSKQVAPDAVMIFLNELFSKFDDLCAVHGVQKVETAGDCYIVSSGVLSSADEGFAEVADEHDPEESTARMFAMAQDMLAAAKEVLMPHDSSPVQIRIGIHTGPCVSGVVGSKLPKYGIFGDTMNTASRMESTCTPGRIQVSSTTHRLLMRSGESVPEEWEATGGVAVKGKGVMETHLWRERSSSYHQPSGERLAASAATTPAPDPQDLQHRFSSCDHADSSDFLAMSGTCAIPHISSGDNIAHGFSDGVPDEQRRSRRSPGTPGHLLSSQPDAVRLASSQGANPMAHLRTYRRHRHAARTSSPHCGVPGGPQSSRSVNGTSSGIQALGQLLTLLSRRNTTSGNGSRYQSPPSEPRQPVLSRLSACKQGGVSNAASGPGAVPVGSARPAPNGPSGGLQGPSGGLRVPSGGPSSRGLQGPNPSSLPLSMVSGVGLVPSVPSKPIPSGTSNGGTAREAVELLEVQSAGRPHGPALIHSRSGRASAGSFAMLGDKIMQVLRGVGHKDKR